MLCEETLSCLNKVVICLPCVAEAEKKRFRDQFLYAEQELAAAKQREQALQEQFLKEVSSFEEQLKKQIQLHSELEVLAFILDQDFFGFLFFDFYS